MEIREMIGKINIRRGKKRVKCVKEKKKLVESEDNGEISTEKISQSKGIGRVIWIRKHVYIMLIRGNLLASDSRAIFNVTLTREKSKNNHEKWSGNFHKKISGVSEISAKFGHYCSHNLLCRKRAIEKCGSSKETALKAQL